MTYGETRTSEEDAVSGVSSSFMLPARPGHQSAATSGEHDQSSVSASSGYSSWMSMDSHTPSPPRRSFNDSDFGKKRSRSAVFHRNKSQRESQPKPPKSPSIAFSPIEKNGNLFSKIGAASVAFKSVGNELEACIPEVATELRHSLLFLNELTNATLRLTNPEEDQSIPHAMDRFETFLDRTDRSVDTFAKSLAYIAQEFKPFIHLFVRTTAMLSLIAASFIVIGILYLLRQYFFQVFENGLKNAVFVPFCIDSVGFAMLFGCAFVAFKSYHRLILENGDVS